MTNIARVRVQIPVFRCSENMNSTGNFYEDNCWNHNQKIEQGTQPSWWRLLETEQGTWIVHRVAIQMGYKLTGGVLGWRVRKIVADYHIIYMPTNTMFRRLYCVLNEVRQLVSPFKIPAEEGERVQWFREKLCQLVNKRNFHYFLKFGYRWMPHYEIETVSIDPGHQIYVEGLTKKTKRRWYRTYHNQRDYVGDLYRTTNAWSSW